MNVANRIRTYGSLVTFSHTVFAMPFAASAIVLAHGVAHLPLRLTRFVAILLCLVSARTSAMAFNRYADRDLDARNPRTRDRHLPARLVRPFEALLLTLASAAVFVVSAASLGRLPGMLSPLVLLVLLGYSFSKRFTWASHAWLGAALALAPGGAWLAMGATPSAGIVSLMFGVVFWLLGFDVLYSLQDEEFDKKHGLFSIPARFGAKRALKISAASHALTVLSFAGTGALLGRGMFFFLGVTLSAALLFYEHRLVAREGLTKINKAVFDMNASVSLGFFSLTLLDELVRRGALK